MSRSLLAHVVARFAPRQWENIATESLLYLLSRPGAAEAMRHLVSPAGLDLPDGLHWRTQAAAATDDSIPDLVADDDQGRHVLIVEAKFWAGLTRNQPVGYLARQQQQFGGERQGSLLLFVAPARRVELLAAELGTRVTSGRLVDQQGVPVVEGAEGRLAVVSWGAVLNLLQAALATDQAALADLDQLRGLCDRADSEAVLPLAAEEVGSSVGRRVWEFADLVDRATDRLIAEGWFTPRGCAPRARRAGTAGT